MDRLRERRLLALAAGFVLFQGTILSLSPAVRARSWAAQLRYSHWVGILIWLTAVVVIQVLSERFVAHRDPLLFPAFALLSGWGILTISRLDPSLGFRQTAWLVISLATAVLLVWRWGDLLILRRYKYLLLAGGLVLVALTILLGTSPNGLGPRLWLGCCGFYLQPSEPLKLLLVLYLAAYLSDRVTISPRAFPFLLPTLLVGGLALLLLVAQRDLGTASILALLYAVVVYAATGKRRVVLATGSLLVLAGLVGFFRVDIVHARLEAWLDPWSDPSGRSFQIVQSLLSVANGGVMGTGLGLGSPGLVPVAQSDFAYSALSEEGGLLGGLGLLTLYALLFSRGYAVALGAKERFHRILAIGVTAYLGIQVLLVTGGDLRMLPLTGVTLPFISYGGSSLLTSTLALALLVAVRSNSGAMPARLLDRRPYYAVAGLLAVGLAVASMTHAWWAIARGPDLLTRTDNARRSIADRYVRRGSILDRRNRPISVTVGQSGSYERLYVYTETGPITGYTDPGFGQAGLESTLDNYLRGLQGNPASLIVLHQLLYGTPPPGLDVRLSVDLDLQRAADEAFVGLKGAAVLIQAESGEILAMASHPAYDPNTLDTTGQALARDGDAPLLNRAAQGMYPVGNSLLPFKVAAGAPSADDLADSYASLGFFSAPVARLTVANAMNREDIGRLHISPLQMALAAGTLSDGGIRPSARIAQAVKTPQQGWVILPPLETPQDVFLRADADAAAARFSVPLGAVWEWASSTTSDGQQINWYIGGTLPGRQAPPVAVAVLIEGRDLDAARRIGVALLQSATSP